MPESSKSPQLELESRIAHQDHVIEELSDQVSKQWQQIDLLKSALKQMGQQLAVLEESVVPDAANTKPPHW